MEEKKWRNEKQCLARKLQRKRRRARIKEQNAFKRVKPLFIMHKLSSSEIRANAKDKDINYEKLQAFREATKYGTN